MIATIPSAVLIGVDGKHVSVEVHESVGLPSFTVVGLPDAAVRESRDRVRAAILSSGLRWPGHRVTVNLAPSGVRKGGAGLDLPIAVGLLVATGVLHPGAVEGMAFVGELGLDGSLRGVPGTMVLAEAVGSHVLVVPEVCAVEAGLSGELSIRSAPNLAALVERLQGRQRWELAPRQPGRGPNPADANGGASPADPFDLSDVRGQRWARRALEVAAAGGHHVLLVGPPGSGKTMLANRFPGLLPPLDKVTAREASRVHSVAGLALPPGGLMVRPPFRAPHHRASPVSMIGGGSNWMRPGEISLAHGGVLFLDELGEFPSVVLEALRQPLEEGLVRVSRARASTAFPARFILIGAMNPCPCGQGGAPGTCECSEVARERYARRLSAPLLDRFDIAIRIDRPDVDDLFGYAPGETTAAVAARVMAARQRTAVRHVRVNAELPAATLQRDVPMTQEASKLLESRMRSGSLSARGLHRVHRLARTLADLEETEDVTDLHIHEALLLRCRRDLLLGKVRR